MLASMLSLPDAGVFVRGVRSFYANNKATVALFGKPKCPKNAVETGERAAAYRMTSDREDRMRESSFSDQLPTILSPTCVAGSIRGS